MKRSIQLKSPKIKYIHVTYIHIISNIRSFSPPQKKQSFSSFQIAVEYNAECFFCIHNFPWPDTNQLDFYLLYLFISAPVKLSMNGLLSSKLSSFFTFSSLILPVYPFLLFSYIQILLFKTQPGAETVIFIAQG